MRIERALLCPYDKRELVPFARGLVELGVEIVSTGNTFRLLKDQGVPVRYVSDVTGFPEILDGRLKTLHPHIHAGVLARRKDPGHMRELEAHGIGRIDLVATNLYPFAETVARAGVTLQEAMENVDIGGPALLRAAAKNHEDVLVVIDPERYGDVLKALRTGDVPAETRRALATEAFAHTAGYDARIASYLAALDNANADPFPQRLFLAFSKRQDLRYGENPHQRAAVYVDDGNGAEGIVGAKQHQGKALSYNNLQDAAAALELAAEFSEPVAVGVKHGTPCGVAVGSTLVEAYQKAYAADAKSIFGGIVALNREVDAATAEELAKIFLDVVLAPGFSQPALATLGRKTNLRLLTVPVERQDGGRAYKFLAGGLLVQEADTIAPDAEPWQVVTERSPSEQELADLRFAWRVVKHVKSNAIVVAKAGQTLGIGGGQVNRIDPAIYALERAGEQARGAVLASEALFPFGDVVAAAGEAGVTAVVQPGGAKRDQESIDGANASGIAMVFTGTRHFKH